MTSLASAAVLAGRFGDAAAAVSEQLQRGVAVVQGNRGGAGSGALWRDDIVITNSHVATGDAAVVSFPDGRPRQARVVARDASVDLAALQIDPAGIEPLAAGDSDRLKVGQLVLAVGNPLGEVRAVTAGIISAVGSGLSGGPIRLSEAVQANITLQPGNSGGPLADAGGRVVGINSMVMGPGVAIAVPSNIVETFLAQRAPGGAVLGVAGQIVELPGEPEGAGVLVAEVIEDSAAETAGLMVGDVLLAIDGTPTASGASLARVLASRRPGEPRRLAFIRGGRRREVLAVPQPRAAAA